MILLLLLLVVVLLLHADADWKSEEFGTQKSPNIWNIPRNTHIQTGFVYRTILSIYFRSIVLLGVLLLSLLLLEQSVGSLYSFILLLHRNGFSRVLPNETARINTLLLRERIKASRKQTLFGDSVSERLVLIADR